MNRQTTDIKKLWDLIKPIQVAMFTSVNTDGTLHSRPMVTQQVEFDGILWFFTQASAHKVEEVHQHRDVSITYADPAKNRFIAISGKARVVHDTGKARELWQPFLRAWFPQGVEDPEVALLRVRVEKAEYWDSPSSKMVQLVGFLTAAEQEPTAEHHTIHLPH